MRETFVEAGASGWAVLRWAVVCCAGDCGWWLCAPTVCPFAVGMGGVRAADPFWSQVSLLRVCGSCGASSGRQVRRGVRRCGPLWFVCVCVASALPALVCFASGDRWLFAVGCWLLACFGRDDARDGREGHGFAMKVATMAKLYPKTLLIASPLYN